MALQWRPELETGHPQIDAEHRGIFVRLNEVEAAMEQAAPTARLGDLLTILEDYTSRHFKNEEGAMRCAHCPAALQHENCAAHEHFLNRLRIWRTFTLHGHAQADLLRQVHAESARWFESHISRVDRRMRADPEATACASL